MLKLNKKHIIELFLPCLLKNNYLSKSLFFMKKLLLLASMSFALCNLPTQKYTMEKQEYLTVTQPEYSTTSEQLKNHMYAHIAELTFDQAALYIEHCYTIERFSRTKNTIKTLEEIRQELAQLLSTTIDRHIISENLRTNQRDSIRRNIITSYTVLDYAFAENSSLTYSLVNALGLQYQDMLHGIRLLHLAIRKGNVDLVNWLLEQSKGNLINLCGVQGRTPLDYAYGLRHDQLCDVQSNTPLDFDYTYTSRRDQYNVESLDTIINLLQSHGGAHTCTR